MPIYEYECRHCGHHFEYLVLSTSPAASCPSCHKKKLTQLISMFAASSESTRKANFATAKKRASVVHKEKQHEDHKQLHDHFEDHYAPVEKKKAKP
jgi:putative FmdB family regulatory protein